jgi:hypothetical protein
MKKLFLIAICALACIALAKAQEDSNDLTIPSETPSSTSSNTTNNDIWKKYTKSFSLGWVTQDFAQEYGSVYHSKFGVMTRFDKTYYLHRRPIAEIIKIGLDAIWSDATIVKLNTENGNRTSNWDSLGDSSYEYDYDDDEDESGSLNLGDIGMWTITESLGVGPSVTIAPFAKSSSGIKYLKAKIYGHYKPSYMAQLYYEDEDFDFKGGFCNIFEIGGRIMYRRISVGIDGNWGSGKFKSMLSGLMSELMEDSDSISDNEKIKHKIANTRVYLSFNF